jgi:cysteine desulfurase
MQPIYVDYAAATPVDERVLAAMQPFWRDQFYNPSSSTLAAKKVKQAVEESRSRVAHWLGAKPAEIIFTAGATESINLAINGIMRNYPQGEVIALATEHDAVRATMSQYAHRFIPVKPDGMCDMDVLKKNISDTTVLVSIGYANNEIGTVQNLKDAAAVITELRRLRQLKNNALPLYLHTDASQAAAYLDLHASRLGVDLLTLNGGKMYGPKQTGVLWVKAGVTLYPHTYGGGQERALRSGTENVPGIIGLATALDIAQSERREELPRITALRDELQRRLSEAFPDMIINGNLKKRLPNNLHVSWSGVDGERLLMLLDERGVMASTGAACAANKNTKSQVLEAIGCDEATAQGSLRLTLGRFTTPEQIKQLAEVIITAVRDTQKL